MHHLQNQTDTKILQNSLDTYEKTSLLPRGKLSHRALINGNRIFPFSSLFLIFLTSHLFSCQRLIHISLILCSKVFYGNFQLFFLEHPMIKLQAKRFELNFLLRLSDLESNFTLTLGYLYPALKNPNQDSRLRSLHMSLVWSHCVVSYKDDLSKGINWLQKLSVGDM